MAPPRVPARSTLTSSTWVAVRSLTVTVSAPPSALKSTRSTPFVSIVMVPASRKNVSRLPLAVRETFSGTLAPLKSIVSAPAWPSMVSLPSPGSQTNVSSPAPMTARSLPRFPSSESFPGPPSIVSAPDPPARSSFPASPASVVGMLSVKTPLLSSMRTWSSPARALTSMLAIFARSKLKSAEPSSPKSTSRMPGSPACRRSVISSLASVPLTVSAPCLSSGSLSPASPGACEALSAWLGGAAYAGPATRPTATAATAEAAHHAGRTTRTFLARMTFLMLFLSV